MLDPCIAIPGIASAHEKCKVSTELCGPLSGLILHKNVMLGPEYETSLNFQGNLQCIIGNTSYSRVNQISEIEARYTVEHYYIIYCLKLKDTLN